MQARNRLPGRDAGSAEEPSEAGGSGEDHPSLETLALLLEGRIESDLLRQEIAPHLAAHCPSCEESLRQIDQAKREVGHWSEHVAVVERREAPELSRRIASRPFAEQLRAVRGQEDLQTWGLCSLLLHRSLELARSARAPEASHEARLALAVNVRLDSAYGPEALADQRSFCLAVLANAHRMLGETQAAGDCFLEARIVLDEEGSGDPRVAAELAMLEGALAYELREFFSARALYEQARTLFSQIEREGAETRLPIEALAGVAAVLREAGQLQQARILLREALDASLPHGTRDLALRDLLQRDLILVLIAEGRLAEAEPLLAEISPRAAERGARRDWLRLRGCAGLIARGLQRDLEAERILNEVREGLLDLDEGYDALIVALELAVLFAELDRTDALEQLGSVLLASFESRSLHREAMAAGIVFQHACQRQMATVTLARHLSSLLCRHRLHTLFHPPPAGFPGELIPEKERTPHIRQATEDRSPGNEA